MFEIRILEQQYDMKDPESKSAFYHEVQRNYAPSQKNRA